MKQIFLYVYRPLEIFFREVSVEIFCSLKKNPVVFLFLIHWGSLYTLYTNPLLNIQIEVHSILCFFFFHSLNHIIW